MSTGLLRKISLEEAEFEQLFLKILDIPALRGAYQGVTSPEVIEQIMSLIISKRGPDPFSVEKAKMNKAATEMIPFLKERISDASEPVKMALKIAILGNTIDFMENDNLTEIKPLISERLEAPVALEPYRLFQQKLNKTRNLIYLTDNAGEIVFDRLFIETLSARFPNLDVHCVVRKVPTLNDATKNEAMSVGLNKIATVLDNGIDGPLPGTLIDRCSQSIKDIFQRADLIIAKGGGNFDTLSESLGDLETDITFLLMCKCYPFQRFFNLNLNQPIIYNYYKDNE
jgi:uncharacterized protein with ATP-grasp and redox domains